MFSKSEIELLGYQVSQDGIAPLPRKFDDIHNMFTPARLQDIQVFDGMIGYYIQFYLTF